VTIFLQKTFLKQDQMGTKKITYLFNSKLLFLPPPLNDILLVNKYFMALQKESIMKKLLIVIGLLFGVHFQMIEAKRCEVSQNCDRKYSGCHNIDQSGVHSAYIVFKNHSDSRMTFTSQLGTQTYSTRNPGWAYCSESDLQAGEKTTVTQKSATTSSGKDLVIFFNGAGDWFTVTAHHVQSNGGEQVKYIDEISVDYYIKDFFTGAEGGDANGSKTFTNQGRFTITTEGGTVNIYRPDGTKITPKS
jgi:hypothetical protein